jgi:hypothetical protein
LRRTQRAPKVRARRRRHLDALRGRQRNLTDIDPRRRRRDETLIALDVCRAGRAIIAQHERLQLVRRAHERQEHRRHENEQSDSPVAQHHRHLLETDLGIAASAPAERINARWSLPAADAF